VIVENSTPLPLEPPRPPNSVLGALVPTIPRDRPLQLTHPHPEQLVRALRVSRVFQCVRREPFPPISIEQRFPPLDDAPTKGKARRVENTAPGLRTIIDKLQGLVDHEYALYATASHYATTRAYLRAVAHGPTICYRRSCTMNLTALLERARAQCEPKTWYRLAKELRVSQARIWKWRKGHLPDNAGAAALAAFLKMPLLDVISYIEEDRANLANQHELASMWSAKLPRLLPSVATATVTALLTVQGALTDGAQSTAHALNALDPVYIMRSWHAEAPV
jgi:hypothetical protein